MTRTPHRFSKNCNGAYDLSSLNAIGTGGAATNPKYQRALLELLPQLTVINGYGSSETGNVGFGRSQRGSEKDTFELREGALVLSEDYSRFLEPDEPEVGFVARAGRIPLGYFDDEAATRKTFPVVDGQRVVISGDRGSLASDGTLRLFGRDSLVVNTGGEKVFVEEVEEVLRAHPAVADALVVGRPSERWGEELVALVAPRDGTDVGASPCTRIARHSWRGSRPRRSSSSSTRFAASATARRTIAGRKLERRNGVTDMTHKAIDCLLNVHFGETEKQPTWMLKVRDDYFKGPESMFAPVDLAELLDEMDEQGVQKAILMDNLAKPSVTARKFVESRPDRFSLAMGGVNLLKPMPSLREAQRRRRRICRWHMPLSGRASGVTASTRPATPSTTRCTPSVRRWNCRCASTRAFPGRRFPVRCRTRSTSTGSASASPS